MGPQFVFMLYTFGLFFISYYFVVFKISLRRGFGCKFWNWELWCLFLSLAYHWNWHMKCKYVQVAGFIAQVLGYFYFFQIFFDKNVKCNFDLNFDFQAIFTQ